MSRFTPRGASEFAFAGIVSSGSQFEASPTRGGNEEVARLAAIGVAYPGDIIPLYHITMHLYIKKTLPFG